MGLAKKELSKDGPKSKAEVFALLSHAKHLYLSALRGTISPSTDIEGQEATAGATIFDATLSALSQYHWDGNLPILGEELFGDATDAAVLPPPILVAMAYFIDQIRSVSLAHLNVSIGNPELDHTILTWSNTILWGLPAKQRFFYDLTDSYSGTPTQHPLLSDNRARAVQLLAVGEVLISRELNRIGEPLYAQIFLPDKRSR